MRPTLFTLAALFACATANNAPVSSPASPEAATSAPPATPSATVESDTPLTDALEARRQGWAQKADEQTIASYEDAITALEATGILTKAKQVGAQAPDFTLPNAQSGETSLSELRKSGPVVLLWYRGGWCPYCNLTLHAYQEALPKLRAAGATLVAITPETPDKTLSTTDKHALAFEVLSDTDNQVARDFGVLFEVPTDVWSRYKTHLKVNTYYHHDRPELPLAATYVIAQDGTVAWSFLSADYRERAEPRDVLKAVQALTK